MSEPEKKDNEENSSKTFGDFVLKFLEDRASDPLWRSYLLFFVIYNWKAFGALILGKAEDPSMRISLATNYFMYNESNIPLFGYILKHIIPYEMHFFIVPFVYSLLFIFVYLKHIKPKIVEIYSKNNGLSLESVKKQLKEKDDEINKLNKEKDDLKKEKVNNIKYNIEYNKLYGGYIHKLQSRLGDNKTYSILETKNHPRLNLNIGSKYHDNGNTYTVISVSMIGFLIEQD